MLGQQRSSTQLRRHGPGQLLPLPVQRSSMRVLAGCLLRRPGIRPHRRRQLLAPPNSWRQRLLLSSSTLEDSHSSRCMRLGGLLSRWCSTHLGVACSTHPSSTHPSSAQRLRWRPQHQQ
jgi:hypothetical protein